MVDRINLDSYAESCISDALYGVTEYDRDALRDAVQEQVHSAADNACIYTHNCYQIISDYERDVGRSTTSAEPTRPSNGRKL
jgi:hypothetical protein